MMCLPARTAASAHGAWVSGGVMTATTSASTFAMASSRPLVSKPSERSAASMPSRGFLPWLGLYVFRKHVLAEPAHLARLREVFPARRALVLVHAVVRGLVRVDESDGDERRRVRVLHARH